MVNNMENIKTVDVSKMSSKEADKFLDEHLNCNNKFNVIDDVFAFVFCFICLSLFFI